MSLSDLLLMRVVAPRHEWKWLLKSLDEAGIKSSTLDDWLVQARVGIPYHPVGAIHKQMEQLRNEFCFCVLTSPSTCRCCKLVDRIVADVETV